MRETMEVANECFNVPLLSGQGRHLVDEQFESFWPFCWERCLPTPFSCATLLASQLNLLGVYGYRSKYRLATLSQLVILETDTLRCGVSMQIWWYKVLTCLDTQNANLTLKCLDTLLF